MTKRLNIEKGTRFGMLTVIKEVEPYRSKWGNKDSELNLL